MNDAIYILMCALLIGGMLGALVTLTTWPDHHARRYLHWTRREAIRRGAIFAAATAIWVGFVLAALGAMLR